MNCDPIDGHWASTDGEKVEISTHGCAFIAESSSKNNIGYRTENILTFSDGINASLNELGDKITSTDDISWNLDKGKKPFLNLMKCFSKVSIKSLKDGLAFATQSKPL